MGFQSLATDRALGKSISCVARAGLGTNALREDVLSIMAKLAQSLPAAKFRFHDINWSLVPRSGCKASNVLEFLVLGRKLKVLLSELYDKPRNWTLCPCIYDNERALFVQHLDEAAEKEVLSWIENGI